MSSASEFATIAIDAMGAELGPAEVVEAVVLALQEIKHPIRLILVGQASVLEPLVTAKGLDNDERVQIQHAPSVVTMDEKPKDSFKNKASSMYRAIELVREGEAGAVISCGNTGSLVFTSTLRLKKIPGVERVALATIIPSREHHWVLIDAGAEPETSAVRLVQNAIMGSQYCKAVLNVKHPRVGLMTIGTEEGKGTEMIANTHQHLKKLEDTIHYVGLIEGFDTFRNVADVVVCDGFTGNILLKSLQSCVRTLKSTLTDALKQNPMRMAGYALAKGAFDHMSKTFAPDRFAGAPFLGLNGVVLKTHGSSNRTYICSCIRIAVETLTSDIRGQMEKDIEKANTMMKTTASSESDQPVVHKPL